ncbi:hypothetical protein SSP35_05_03420 [Streptomyces sp. NBRC 110611]|uniref:hypothetical protein n=1 Tax=Streptomyces sp. NBRC 110611 TaxID=1621259 RepID=UPI00082990EF|nr:hypothetical protein [Streptomyces sp. NBRC 110611]GAU67775.1 hypothetical protein SSP35_05_03420 [Streptomyces sp. NBRC 110611]
MRGIIGFIFMIQGALGFVSQTFFDRTWGLLAHWFDLPSVAYLGLFAAGAALAVWGDMDRKRRKRGQSAGSEAA